MRKKQNVGHRRPHLDKIKPMYFLLVHLIRILTCRPLEMRLEMSRFELNVYRDS